MTDEQKLALLESPEAKALLERLANPVTLHPDLVPFVEDAEFGTSIRHPLVYAVPYHPTMNGTWNEAYEAKKAQLAEYMAAGKIGEAVFLHEKPHRVPTLLALRDEVKDPDEYWRIFGEVYTNSENLWQVHDELIELLLDKRPGQQNMMKDDERRVWEKLPPYITVYRGHQYHNSAGFSWSLSYTRALWFARRHGEKTCALLCGKVKKEHVIGFFNRRKEMDILLWPEYSHIEDMWEWTNVPPVGEYRSPFQRTFDEKGNAVYAYPEGEKYARLLELTAPQFKLDTANTNHGPDHWLKVSHNGNEIADRYKAVDRGVVQAFAMIHDCQRENEHRDPDHGHRAADYMKRNKDVLALLDFTPKQRQQLEHALRYHNEGEVSSDPTIGACWDADRLDLVRVGYVPNPQLFSTDAGRSLIFNV